MFVLKLHCACGLPWAHISNGALIVESRHNGKLHANSIPLSKLLAAIRGSEVITDEALMDLLIRSLKLPMTISDELLSNQYKGLDKSP